MIDAKELRIGNRAILKKEVAQDLYDQGFEGKSVEVEIVGIETMYAQINFDGVVEVPLTDLKPIPLTEDWLVRFGFEKNPFTYSIDISDFPDQEYKKLVVDLDQGILIRNGGLLDYRHKDQLVTLINFDIKKEACTVHQLQNLYFSLTGKELQLTDAVNK